MKFGENYILLFIVITLSLSETTNAAQICVDVPGIGRVCVPDLINEQNSDFGSNRFRSRQEYGQDECPEGMVRIFGNCRNPDCPNGCGGGQGIGAPCPQGTRADQHGNCRQQLF